MMEDDDEYNISVRSMDWAFDVQEWSYEYAIYFEFFERHLQRLRPMAREYD